LILSWSMYTIFFFCLSFTILQPSDLKLYTNDHHRRLHSPFRRLISRPCRRFPLVTLSSSSSTHNLSVLPSSYLDGLWHHPNQNHHHRDERVSKLKFDLITKKTNTLQLNKTIIILKNQINNTKNYLAEGGHL
jgi:hypothetical protein